MTTHYLEPNQVPSHLKRGYSGKRFTAQASEQVTIPSYAGLWDGGSRDTYQIIRLADGAVVAASNNSSAPWDNKRVNRIVTLEPGIAVVEHSITCGKDMGLRFYVHPSDIVKMLPATVELTETERLVLTATKTYKSSYNGMDRYDMATGDFRYANKPYPSRDEWNAAKQALVERKLLNRAGAITVSGKNAVA